MDESVGSAPSESSVGLGPSRVRGGGRGRRTAPVAAASQALASNRTRTCEVRPAARMDTWSVWVVVRKKPC